MNILISGAGIAGLSLAVNLSGRGHRVTVIEYASHFRVNGSPIDVRGDSIEIAGRMGLLPQIREQSLSMTEQGQFVDSDGEVIAALPFEETSDTAEDIEIAREDLADILVAALADDTEVRFHDSVTALDDDGDGVDVRFRSGRSERYDLVIGADGLHSAVRRLAFGPEKEFIKHLGFYTALTDLPGRQSPERISPIYNAPGRMVSIARYKDRALGVFLFRSDPLDYDHHDLDAQKKILLDAFAGHTEWRIPELLEAARTDPELYFDSSSQIHLPTWHKGRVALVGDAAHCASGLSGRGTSLALTGGYFLAEELDAQDGHAAAFSRYEARQRPYAEYGQNIVGAGADLIVPPTWEAIAARNARLLAAAG